MQVNPISTSIPPDHLETVGTLFLRPLCIAFGNRKIVVTSPDEVHHVAIRIFAGLLALTILLPFTLTGFVLLKASSTYPRPLQSSVNPQTEISNARSTVESSLPNPISIQEPTMQANVPQPVEEIVVEETLEIDEEYVKSLDPAVRADAEKILQLEEGAHRTEEIMNLYAKTNVMAKVLASICEKKHIPRLLRLYNDYEDDPNALKELFLHLIKRGAKRAVFETFWNLCAESDQHTFFKLIRSIPISSEQPNFAVAWETLLSAPFSSLALKQACVDMLETNRIPIRLFPRWPDFDSKNRYLCKDLDASCAEMFAPRRELCDWMEQLGLKHCKGVIFEYAPFAGTELSMHRKSLQETSYKRYLELSNDANKLKKEIEELSLAVATAKESKKMGEIETCTEKLLAFACAMIDHNDPNMGLLFVYGCLQFNFVSLLQHILESNNFAEKLDMMRGHFSIEQDLMSDLDRRLSEDVRKSQIRFYAWLTSRGKYYDSDDSSDKRIWLWPIQEKLYFAQTLALLSSESTMNRCVSKIFWDIDSGGNGNFTNLYGDVTVEFMMCLMDKDEATIFAFFKEYWSHVFQEFGKGIMPDFKAFNTPKLFSYACRTLDCTTNEFLKPIFRTILQTNQYIDEREAPKRYANFEIAQENIRMRFPSGLSSAIDWEDECRKELESLRREADDRLKKWEEETAPRISAGIPLQDDERLRLWNEVFTLQVSGPECPVGHLPQEQSQQAAQST